MRRRTLLRVVLGVVSAAVVFTIVAGVAAAFVLYQIGKSLAAAAAAGLVEVAAFVGTVITVAAALLCVVAAMLLVQTPPLAGLGALGKLIAAGIAVWEIYGVP